jgi:hypothetical protein
LQCLDFLVCQLLLRKLFSSQQFYLWKGWHCPGHWQLSYLFNWLFNYEIRTLEEMLFRIFMNISEQCTRRYLFLYLSFLFLVPCIVLVFSLFSFVIYAIRLLKLILRILKQTIGDLTLRKMIWLIFTRNARVIWRGNKEFWWTWASFL